MPLNVSPVTGEGFYSGTWEDLKTICRVLNVSEGKLGQISEIMVNLYQERVDRNIDAILTEVCFTPIRAMNQVQPDGTTKRVFPGDIRAIAQYWTAALLLQNEFQNLSQNTTDQTMHIIEDVKKQLYAVTRFNHRIPGVEMRSNISKTLPAQMQPAAIPEPNW